MKRSLYLLRLLWVLMAILLLANVGFKLPGRATVLLDVSYSSKAVFGEGKLKGLVRRFREVRFAVKTFGSDTLTDIYSAIKGASSPILLISDGIHNGEGDPLSVAYDREVSVLLLRPKGIPPKITHIWMRTPATIGKTVEMRVEFSTPVRDTVVLIYGNDRKRAMAEGTATFRIKVKGKERAAKLLSPGDTVEFKVFGREAGGIGILVWTPNPVVRFVRWALPDALLRLVGDSSIPRGHYAFTVYVDPPPGTLSVARPSLYFLGPRGNFKVARGVFYLKGDVPPIREIYLPDIKYDRVYEKVGDFPLIASKGNALFVLSPDMWKVWLANHRSYERFLGYLREFVVRDYEVYADKPLYALGERVRINVFPPFPMTVSINRGKPVRITSLYTYTKRLGTGDTLFVVDIFRRGVRVASETVRINLRKVPSEKVYLGVDTILLKNLAAVSGGRVFREPEEAIKYLKDRGGRRLSLSSLLPLFLLVVLLAWTEWFLRRARGMV